ncbi:MAG: transposase domain-containing protein [Bacteriovoracaceae bacterium]|nr:transposase domain-containing protein [Bacteriovoracaceae bacterium]
MRSPVIGRKTWYGTHSKRGAKTTAIMFSIVQSCKLNKINPREYLRDLVRDILQAQHPYSPYQYTHS